MRSMNKIRIRDLSGKSSLLRRGTADQILEKVDPSEVDPDSSVVIDFGNIVALTPSFFDQLLGGLKLKYSKCSTPISLCFVQVPTRASEKFAAIGRSHGMILKETANGKWLLVESGLLESRV